MKRNLITQMKNEWRSNVWLIVELAIVTLAIWLLIALFYAMSYGRTLPLGFDPTDVYTVSMRTLSKESPDRIEYENGTQGYFDDTSELIRRLRANPNVQSVAPTRGAELYTFNYYGLGFVPAEGDSIWYTGNALYATPEAIETLGIKSRTGATSAQLAEMLKRGEILVGDNNDYSSYGRDPMDLKGKEVLISGDTANIKRVGDIIYRIRRSDYEDSWGGFIICPESPEKSWLFNIMIRVKPGRGKAFEADFNNDAELRSRRNTYFTQLESLETRGAVINSEPEADLRTLSLLTVFLLVTIFLGLLGTFWFRMQQRTQEIAIRKVCGATSGQIFRRVLGEGMLLLTLAVAIISAIVWPFYTSILEIIGNRGWEALLLLELVAVALVAFGVVISLWYPARRAMAIEPALAIKDE